MRRRGAASRGFVGLLSGLVVLATPSTASAHLVTTGMGPVYDGIGHLLVSPEDLVPALAIALLAGLRGADAGRRTMFLVPLAWLAGGLAGSAAPVAAPAPVTAVSFLVLGGLVAADLRMPAAAVAALAVAFGLVHGFLNGAVLRGGPGTPGLLGIAVVMFVILAVASAFVVSLGRPWARVAVRVAGSWIAAVGLLMIGWALR